MSRIIISQLVEDWGGFDILAAHLCKAGSLVVDHDVTLAGRSGAPHQIDVLVQQTQESNTRRIIVEYRNRDQSIDDTYVMALAATMLEVGAERGVILTTKKVQVDTIVAAARLHIDLFMIREQSIQTWICREKVQNFWLHLIGFGINAVQFEEAFCFGGAYKFDGFSVQAPQIGLAFADQETLGTAIYAEARAARTLERLLTDLAVESCRRAHQPRLVHFGVGGYEGEVLFRANVNYHPDRPLEVFIDKMLLVVPKMTFGLGVRIEQSRLSNQYAQDLSLRLALQDCIERSMIDVKRLAGEGFASVSWHKPNGSVDTDDTRENDVVFSMWEAGVRPFEQFAGLEPGKPVSRPLWGRLPKSI